MTEIPETDSKMQSVHLTAPVPSEVFTTRESLRERCEMFVRCLPQAPMRDMLARLFEDLLALHDAPRGTDAQILEERELTSSAIQGAMAFGYQGANPPPSPDHWLAEFWNIGQTQRRLEDAAPHHRSAVGAPGSNNPDPESESLLLQAAQALEREAKFSILMGSQASAEELNGLAAALRQRIGSGIVDELVGPLSDCGSNER